MESNNSSYINASLGSGELAFLGDAVYSLLVRESLVKKSPRRTAGLHKSTTEFVCATAQAKAVKAILPYLNPQEHAVFLRGRNRKCGNLPRSCSAEDYAYATGLESLFGYLWISSDFVRIRELFEIIDNQ